MRKKKEKRSSIQPLWGEFPGEPRNGLNQDTLGQLGPGEFSGNAGYGQLRFGIAQGKHAYGHEERR